MKELKEERQRLDAKGKRLAAEEVKKRRSLKAELVYGYTRRVKKMAKIKKKGDVVCDRAKKADSYAYLAVGKGNDRRAITVPGEVAELFVDKFKQLMGFERKALYSGLKIGEDSVDGLRLRRRIAEEMPGSLETIN